jgi:hypothetical protein
MKAREKSRRILRNPPALNVTHTAPTRGWALPEVPELKRGDWQPLLDAFRDADNLGSLISPPEVDEAALAAQIGAFEASGRQEVSGDAPRLRQLLEQTRLLRRPYRAVVANPPYMGGKAFNKVVKDFVTAKYPRSKSDLFAVFMERALELTASKGIMGMVNQHAWMFLSSYEGLREYILDNFNLQSMIHLGARAFPEVGGEVVQSTAFTIAKEPPQRTPSTFVRLVDLNSSAKKEEALLGGLQRYVRDNQQDFEKIPGSPIAYWVSERVLEAFETMPTLSSLVEIKSGMSTGNNDRFLRYWFEIKRESFYISAEGEFEATRSGKRWFPYNKGGYYRRWYGNQEYVIDWENNGERVKNWVVANPNDPNTTSWARRIFNYTYFFRESLSWSKVSSENFAVRAYPPGFIFADAGCSIFLNGKTKRLGLLGMLNSQLSQVLIKELSPTVNFETNHVGNLPAISGWDDESLQVQQTAASCIAICQADWNNFEISWNFQTDPLLHTALPRLTDAFTEWQETANAAFYELKRLELLKLLRYVGERQPRQRPTFEIVSPE